MVDGMEHRILNKAFGLRFIITVSGVAGKFSILRLTLAIGSGMGLLAIASYCADFVMLHCTKKDKKSLYKTYKEVHVKHSKSIVDVLESNKWYFIKHIVCAYSLCECLNKETTTTTIIL